VIAIEIQLLLDRLEAVLNESRQLPFSAGVLVDRDRCYDIINQLRVAIPQEVKRAQRMQQERERIIAQAKEEAERIVILAREQAESLAEEQRFVEQVETEAQDVRRGADEYALSVLQRLESNLLRQLTTVRNGIATLEPQDSREATGR
jgi:hypothetical protein